MVQLLSNKQMTNKTNNQTYKYSITINNNIKGQLLQFNSNANVLNQTEVYLNGEYKRGYIKASDVDVMVSNPESREGTGLKSPTHVYASTSTGSKKLKSYKKGSTLKYSTFSENWYRTGVYINGKKH